MIEYEDKQTGSLFTAGNANEIKSEVNKLYTRGEALINDPVTVAIAEQNEWVIIGTTAVGGNLVGFTFDSGVFTFTEPENFSMLVASMACESPSNNNEYQFGIFKNGVHLYSKPVDFRFANTTQTIVLNKLLNLSEGDTIDLRVRNVTNSEDILIETMSTTIN